MKAKMINSCSRFWFLIISLIMLSGHVFADGDDFDGSPLPGKDYWVKMIGDFSKVNDVMRVYELAPFNVPKDNDPIRNRNKFFKDAQLISRTIATWQKKSGHKIPSIGCDRSCRAIYKNPKIGSDKIGAFDDFGRIFISGNVLNPSPSYSFYEGSDDGGVNYLIVIDIRHVVHGDRIIEWVKLPTPDHSEAWLPLNPFGNAKAPAGSKEGDVIPTNFRISYVESLKHSKLTDQFCVEDIKDGEVSFYAFMVKPDLAVWFAAKSNLAGNETSTRTFDDYDFDKLHEASKSIAPFLDNNISKNNIVIDFLDKLSPYKPQLFKMSFEKFYFKFLASGLLWHQMYRFSPFEYPVDCMQLSRFMFKDVGGFKERRKWVTSNNGAEIFKNSKSLRTLNKSPTLLKNKITEAWTVIDPYFVKSYKEMEKEYPDILLEYVHAPSSIPGTK